MSTYKEGNENRSIHQDESQDGGPAVAESVGDGASGEDTNESTTLTGLEKGTLPAGGNDIAIAVRNTVSLLKSAQGDEVTVEEHVEGFHDLWMILLVLICRRMI
jgi:hypothetical protein